MLYNMVFIQVLFHANFRVIFSVIDANGSRLGEVAEHKTSLVVQTLKLR